MKIDAQKPFGTRECPSCATEVPANNNRCPICSYVFLQPTSTQRNMKLIGAIVMLVLFLILIFGLM
jgi:predicted nucleic acid-binding Zn ribbon protein